LAYKNALSSYKETRITTASQGQLIIMLYDEAVRQLNTGLELMKLNSNGKKEPGRIEKISKAILKTEEIITELLVSLDFEKGGDISKSLFAIYTWFNRELMEANINQDIGRLEKVRDLIDDLRSTWHEIAKKSQSETAGREVVGLDIAG
jgi:flagellar protein FliS